MRCFGKGGKKSDWADLTTAEKAAREKLKTTILDDVARANPEARGLREIGDKHWGAVANFNQVAKIYRNGLVTLPSGDVYLNPTKLADAIYASKKQILDNPQLGEEVWSKMKKEADYYKKMAPSWRPPDRSKQRVVGGMLPGLSLTGTLAFTHPALLAVSEPFGFASAWALMWGLYL